MARQGEPTIKAKLHTMLEERQPALIDPALYTELRAALEPVSESYLEHLLRDAGVPLHPMVEGVSLHSPEDLRRTLLGLADVYEASSSQSERQAVREKVIAGKVRLRALIARTETPNLRKEREQMHEELMTWLENPGIFPMWLRLKLQSSETMKAHDSGY